VAEVLGRHDAELQGGERDLDVAALAEQRDLDPGAAAVQLGEGQHAEGDGPPRRDGAGVEEDEVVAAHRRLRGVVLVVHAEVERGGARAVAVRDHLGQPRRRADAVQPSP
jgi:hypothetical protein